MDELEAFDFYMYTLGRFSTYHLRANGLSLLAWEQT